MDITAGMITQLATLARLDTAPAEEAKLADQLPKIIDYVGQLQSVMTERVPEVRDESAELRHDEVRPFAGAEAILDQAPERLDRYWKVSSVFS